MNYEPRYLLVLILGLAVGAQWLAAKIKLPALLLLMSLGLLLGPGSEVFFGAGGRIIDPEQLLGELWTPFLTLSVAIVLFEGGLTLDLKEAKYVGPALLRLLVSGMVVGFTSVTLLGIYVGGLSLGTASVLGAILVVTGPTVILPMLRAARIALRPAALLKWEGIVNDPFGGLLAFLALKLTLLSSEDGGGADALKLGLTFLGAAIAAGLLGAMAGFVLARMLRRRQIPHELESLVLLASVCVVFVLTDAVHHECGLLGVTVMGVVLANVRDPSIEALRHFKEQVSTLLVGVLFIALSAHLTVDTIERMIGPPLLMVALILFVSRPLVGLFASMGTSLPWNERALICWIAPRGVVAAAVAGAFEPRLLDAGVEDAELLVPIVFGVIASTVLLHGLTIRPLARKLGLASHASNGILLVGASHWGIALGQALAKAGAFVILADTRFRRVSKARMEGLEVYYGDALAEDIALELPMERIAWIFAATDDDSYNSLVSLRYASDLGRQHALQLAAAERPPTERPTGEKGAKEQPSIKGTVPWDGPLSWSEITRRYWKGASFKVTTLSEDYPWEQFREDQPEAFALFILVNGALEPVSSEKQPANGKLVYFTGMPPS
ncbi:MAG: sodium:proton exchanger [Planctomycetota bacterium]|nr:MAG: sodium:proton exchanger [Planctomycetota bacterium]